MPPKVIRSVLSAIGGPFRWAQTTGYFRSALAGKAVDQHGKPIPWYCISAVQFLDIIDFSSADVLEFGSGQSTLWWASKAHTVTSFEQSSDWYRYVIDRVPGNASVVLAEDLVHHARAPIDLDRTFDVVIIDGGDRALAAQTALMLVKPDGLVVFDNSEGFWGEVGTYPILDLFDGAGYFRIDFNGYAPGVLSTSVTSLFFLPACRWLHHLPPPCRGHR
ncbi:MAG: O-methyltransferase [Acidimicrobiales bacterium]